MYIEKINATREQVEETLALEEAIDFQNEIVILA